MARDQKECIPLPPKSPFSKSDPAWPNSGLCMIVSKELSQKSEGSRELRPETISFVTFLITVDVYVSTFCGTKANFQAHVGCWLQDVLHRWL